MTNKIATKQGQVFSRRFLVLFCDSYSISRSFVARNRAEDSANARRGESDKVTDGLGLELVPFSAF